MPRPGSALNGSSLARSTGRLFVPKKSKAVLDVGFMADLLPEMQIKLTEEWREL